MSIELPLYVQEKRNTCALACLRMVLATVGTKVEEETLEAQATMEVAGTPIEELERLARQFGLVAEIQETTVEQLQQILDEGKLPIAYLDRVLFAMPSRRRAKYIPRDPKIHNVIPTRVSPSYVTFHDPLPPRITRRSIGVFRHAYRILGLGFCTFLSQDLPCFSTLLHKDTHYDSPETGGDGSIT